MCRLCENYDIIDVRELFERGIDPGLNTRISANTWRIGGAAQVQRVSAWCRSQSLHVQSEYEIGSADWIGYRATSRAS